MTHFANRAVGIMYKDAKKLRVLFPEEDVYIAARRAISLLPYLLNMLADGRIVCIIASSANAFDSKV